MTLRVIKSLKYTEIFYGVLSFCNTAHSGWKCNFMKTNSQWSECYLKNYKKKGDT